MRTGLLTAAVLLAVTLAPAFAGGEKRSMDIEDFDAWQSVRNVKSTPDGKVLAYNVNPQEGDGILYVKVFPAKGDKKASVREISIDRGTEAKLDPSGKWLYCTVKPSFQTTRQEKIKKTKADKMTPDTLAVVNLKDLSVRKFARTESFATGRLSMPYVAYKSNWTVKEKADSTEKVSEKKESGLVFLDPSRWKADTLRNVDSYKFSESGLFMAYTTKKDKKDSLSHNSLNLAYQVDRVLKTETVSKDKEAYGAFTFNDQDNALAFTATTDTNKTGDKRHSLSLAKFSLPAATKKAPNPEMSLEVEELMAQGHGVNDGVWGESGEAWTLNQNSGVFFTPDGHRIFTGVGEIRPPEDTSIVRFEWADLDIWNWDAPYTPPQQKKRQSEITKKTYMTTIDLAGDKKPVLLTDKFFERVRLLDGGQGEWAVAIDETEYERASTWDYKSYFDLALVSLKDGSRKSVAKKLSGYPSVSPKGKYIAYFSNDDHEWHTIDIATLEDATITEGLGVKFHDEENDKPMDPEPYSSPYWTLDDKAILLTDRYDVWKISPDGNVAENITNGQGRAKGLRFGISVPETLERTSNQSLSQAGISIDPSKRLRLTVKNEKDMTNGFGSISLSKPAKTLKYFTDKLSFQNVTKPYASDRYYFLSGNFRECYDLYYTDDDFASREKLTAINPQKEELRWGDAELFEWKAYDGTPLKGLVFIPEGIKEGEKLPVMVYFYEKYSSDLHNFFNPGPSRSTVSPSYYTSRGYVFFIPDIIYEVGHPGESAYNCVCSGAEALCEKYSFCDKTKIGIQGQSWGGYQTAYLVTRTDMFAAAGAGAPVGNMTSAYGGIRWESGITRAGQYEHGQSRIGKNLWEEGALDLYVENSPVFHADKVNTPILIMHNDADGAVPWYQGIEYFSNLRRLGKPSWLLQYNNEAHNLLERRNCLDLTRRLQQFFDHYLKGEPAPAWMTKGVPTDRKSEYAGFEYAE